MSTNEYQNLSTLVPTCDTYFKIVEHFNWDQHHLPANQLELFWVQPVQVSLSGLGI